MSVQSTRHEILLRLTPSGWTARSTDPDVARNFGMDVIPLAFDPDTDPEIVLARMRQLNPDYEVHLEDEHE